MNFKIEGSDLLFEIEVEKNGFKREAIVKMDGGQWSINRGPYERTWLAQGRTLFWKVVEKALMTLMLDVDNDAIAARRKASGDWNYAVAKPEETKT